MSRNIINQMMLDRRVGELERNVKSKIEEYLTQPNNLEDVLLFGIKHFFKKAGSFNNTFRINVYGTRFKNERNYYAKIQENDIQIIIKEKNEIIGYQKDYR